MKDPWGNIFEIEEDYFEFTKSKAPSRGSNRLNGVSDMERSIDFMENCSVMTANADAEGVFTTRVSGAIRSYAG